MLTSRGAGRGRKAPSGWALLAGLALLVLLGAFGGCAREDKITAPNLPPQTYLAIADSVRNITVYSQTLRWWGEDRDGEVIGYEYRWFTDPTEPGCKLDTAWVRTEETSGTFDLPVSDGTSVHRFEVRAVDDRNESDPTPCQLRLPVRNSPPAVMIWHLADLPDTTFPAFLATWHGSDPEGDETVARYLVWLDGSRQAAKTITPPDSVASFGLEDFDSRFETTRTLSLVAIDAGCDTSDVVTYTWYVKQPRGRVLLVDDLGDVAGAGEMPTDRFYRAGLDSCGEAYSVLDIERFGGLLSACNLYETFSIFDLVIWYNEPLAASYPTASPHLTVGEGDLKAYVEDDGSILIASAGALGSGGAMRDSLWPEVFGIDSIFVRNGTTSNDLKRCVIQSALGPTPDSLKLDANYSGAECFRLDPGATPLYYVRAGILGAYQTEDYYVGVLNSWQGGRAAILTFPLSRSNLYGNARRQYCGAVDLLLN